MRTYDSVKQYKKTAEIENVDARIVSRLVKQRAQRSLNTQQHFMISRARDNHIAPNVTGAFLLPVASPTETAFYTRNLCPLIAGFALFILQC